MPEIIDPLTATQQAPSLAPTKPTFVEPPRLRHNRELAMAYLKANKVYSRYPKITDQIECVPIDLTKLYPFGYNPAIVEYMGKVLMVYRYHGLGLPSSRLAICELKDGAPISNKTLDLNGKSLEDARLCVHDDSLIMVWVESTVPESPPKAKVHVGELEPTSGIVESETPNIGRNDLSTIEKNWVPFIFDGRSHLIYECHPKQRIFSNLHLNWTECPSTTSGRWPYGAIHGGTPPLPYDGKWIRFFHSSLDNEMNPQRRRYYMGALIMEPEPPFQTIRVSKKPILYGSEVDNLTPTQRKSCIHWKPQVVFPGGAIEREGGWLVSVGVNDSACAVAKIKPDNLNL